MSRERKVLEIEGINVFRGDKSKEFVSPGVWAVWWTMVRGAGERSRGPIMKGFLDQPC